MTHYANVYVDLPSLGAAWTNVAIFTTKEDAVAWIREHIGECDNDGKISLITLGEVSHES